MANRSGGFEFVLTGFPGIPPRFDILVSITMFIVYDITLVLNGSVMVLIIMKEKLHEPPYIMIANLAFSNFFFDTVNLPKFIAKYFDGGRISFVACIIQVYFVHFLAGVDPFILMLMAFDRYAAICRPLRYSSIVTHRVTMIACGIFWVLVAFLNLLIAKHVFCGPNDVLSFFCNIPTLARLACDNVTSTRQAILSYTLVFLLTPLTFIILSYAVIILSIISLKHSKGWRKALSTCTSHWIVITLFYIPRLCVYIGDFIHLLYPPDLSVFFVFLYAYLPHISNPLIYSLRTEKIKRTIANILQHKTGSEM